MLLHNDGRARTQEATVKETGARSSGPANRLPPLFSPFVPSPGLLWSDLISYCGTVRIQLSVIYVARKGENMRADDYREETKELAEMRRNGRTVVDGTRATYVCARRRAWGPAETVGLLTRLIADWRKPTEREQVVSVWSSDASRARTRSPTPADHDDDGPRAVPVEFCIRTEARLVRGRLRDREEAGERPIDQLTFEAVEPSENTSWLTLRWKGEGEDGYVELGRC